MDEEFKNLQRHMPVLSDRKSKRTTFRLTDDVKDDLNWMKDRFGRTAKDLIEDIMQTFGEIVKNYPKILERDDLKNIIVTPDVKSGNRQTMVLTKETFRILKELSKNHKLPRDKILNLAIKFFRVFYESRIKETKAKHQDALKILDKLNLHLSKTEEKIKRLLGDNDPVYYRFGYLADILENLISSINHELGTGEPVDPDSLI